MSDQISRVDVPETNPPRGYEPQTGFHHTHEAAKHLEQQAAARKQVESHGLMIQSASRRASLAPEGAVRRSSVASQAGLADSGPASRRMSAVAMEVERKGSITNPPTTYTPQTGFPAERKLSTALTTEDVAEDPYLAETNPPNGYEPQSGFHNTPDSKKFVKRHLAAVQAFEADDKPPTGGEPRAAASGINENFSFGKR